MNFLGSDCTPEFKKPLYERYKESNKISDEDRQTILSHIATIDEYCADQLTYKIIDVADLVFNGSVDMKVVCTFKKCYTIDEIIDFLTEIEEDDYSVSDEIIITEVIDD